MSSRALPRSRRIKWALPDKLFLALAGIGLLDTAYLAWGRLTGASLVCLTGSGCSTVSASPYAYVLGIPLSYLGLGLYVVLIAGMIYLHRCKPGRAAIAAALLFACNIAGACFSAYLTWLSVTVIGATCNWCVMSAAILWLLLPLTFRIANRIAA